MPDSFAHLLYEIRRKAGHKDFSDNEAVTVIRQIAVELELFNLVVQVQARGPTYFVEDDALRRNFCINPSFEHDFTSWTESKTATGTTARITTQKNYGLTSFEAVMTDSAGSGEVIQRRLDSITGLAASEVWSIGVDVRIEALSNAKMVLRLEFLDVSDVVQATHNVESTTVSTSWVQLKNENRTSPANTTKIRVTLILESTAINATGTVQFDGVMVEKASTIGTAFDGDSTGGFWEGVLHGSENILDVDGIAAIVGFFKAS